MQDKYSLERGKSGDLWLHLECGALSADINLTAYAEKHPDSSITKKVVANWGVADPVDEFVGKLKKIGKLIEALENGV